jgi:hypothetical protein
VRLRSQLSRALVVAVLVGVAPGGPGPALTSAQPSVGTDTMPKFLLGTVSGETGTTVAVPLFYESAARRPIRRVHLEVEYVTTAVQFVKAEKGSAAKTQDYDLVVQEKAIAPGGTNGDRTRLTIDVSVVGGTGTEKVPVGMLASLEFKVPEEAPGDAISLGLLTVAARDAADDAVKAATEDGSIVIAIPLLACFFYMH